MSVISAIVPLAGLIWLAWYYWKWLFAETDQACLARFGCWLGRGLLFPLLAWLALNSGCSSKFPPLIPEIAEAQAARRNWVPLMFEMTLPGTWTIGTFWTAVTFVYLMTEAVLRAERRENLFWTAGLLSVVLVPVTVFAGWAGGWAWSGLALLLWLVPLAHYSLPWTLRPTAPPDYSRATARLKFGKFKEAEWAVLNELEKNENDFEGWMMLAELYSHHFGDLQEADRTVRSICDQPGTTPLQISIAFHRLADWHLKLTDNPLAARRALQEIIRRLPHGHFARMAQLRIQQLPVSRQQLLEQRKPKVIRLPALTDTLGEVDVFPAAAPTPRSDALGRATELVEILRQDPNDAETREKLAFVYAEQLGKADLGIEQLELLSAMAGQPEQKLAHWLSLVGAWQLRFRGDRAEARSQFERLIREYPHSAEAFAAQRLLSLMEMESKFAKK